jgi:hypothetical protein
MDSRELVEWEVFHHRVEPIGDVRMDWLFAMLGNLLALVNGNKTSKIQDYVMFPMKFEASPKQDAPVKPEKPPNVLRAKMLNFFNGQPKRGSRSKRVKGS